MRENKGRWSVTFTGVALLLTTLILSTVTTTSPAEAQQDSSYRYAAGSRTTARWADAIDTRSQSAVNAAYWAQYAPKQLLSIDWLLGSLLGCHAGITSGSTNAATLSSLNFVRSLAGLGPVSFSPALNSSAQQAALIMAANGSLSHYPSSSWRCWSSTGARAASRSNLALAYPSLRAGQIIDLYMDDPGSDNVAAGHRRWILNPFSTVMGSGSTATANALTVVGPTSAARPNPRWVGWPSAGYFPNAIEPRGRWSLSSGLSSVSFTRARIAVYRGTVRIPVHKYPVHNGYAQPTMVWQMPPNLDENATYRVVVTGIRKAGLARALRMAYTVRLFTPSH
ncbi:MAG: CAP domain-containing protein [Marmoricola sp.]